MITKTCHSIWHIFAMEKYICKILEVEEEGAYFWKLMVLVLCHPLTRLVLLSILKIQMLYHAMK